MDPRALKPSAIARDRVGRGEVVHSREKDEREVQVARKCSEVLE